MKRFLGLICLLILFSTAYGQIYVKGQKVPDTVKYLTVMANLFGKTDVVVDYGQKKLIWESNVLTNSMGKKIAFAYLGDVITFFERNGYELEYSFLLTENEPHKVAMIFKNAKANKNRSE